MIKGLSHLIFFSFFAVSISGCSGGNDDSNDQQTEDPVNSKPVVNAGVDRSVSDLSTVVVKATASDEDGRIVKFDWKQSTDNGLEINAEGHSSDTLTFKAPAVSQETAIEFEITVFDNDGAQASDRVTITIVPDEKKELILQGKVTHPTKIDVIRTESNGETFQAVVNEDGSYSLEIIVDKDEIKYPLFLEAISNDSVAKLVAITNDVKTLLEGADDNKVVSFEQESSIQVSHVSTALAGILAMDFDLQLDTERVEVGSLRLEIDGASVIGVASAIDLSILYEGEELGLPAGFNNTWEFANDRDALESYLSKLEQEQLLPYYEESINRTVNDPAVIQNYKGVPQYYSRIIKEGVGGIPVVSETMWFGTLYSAGEIEFLNNLSVFGYTFDERLYLTFQNEVTTESEVEENIGGTYQTVKRQVIYDNLTLAVIGRIGNTDVVYYKAEGKYHYPNGEKQDAPLLIKRFSTFLTGFKSFTSNEIVGERVLPIQAEELFVDEVVNTSYGPLTNHIQNNVVELNFKEDGTVTTGNNVFGVGEYSSGNRIEVNFQTREIDISKLTDSMALVTIRHSDPEDGGFLGVVSGISRLKQPNLEFNQTNVTGVYALRSKFSDPLNRLWFEINENGTGRKGVAGDYNHNGLIEDSEYSYEPISWALEEGKLVIKRFKDLNYQSCESLNANCYTYSKRVFELYHMENGRFTIKTEYRINNWPIAKGVLDEELLGLWDYTTYQVREWEKLDQETPDW